MNNMDEIDYDFAIEFWENQATELLKENQSLKAELTYWKETAEYWKEKSFEIEATTKI